MAYLTFDHNPFSWLGHQSCPIMKSIIGRCFERWRNFGIPCQRRTRSEETNTSDNHSTQFLSFWRCGLPVPAQTRKKPQWTKSPLFTLVCLNMLVCGIEFCASAGFTYIPPMLLKAGFGEASMTCVMAVGKWKWRHWRNIEVKRAYSP